MTDRAQQSESAERLLADRARCERLIAGALKSAIDAHGPVTLANRSSAAKRVYATLIAARRN